MNPIELSFYFLTFFSFCSVKSLGRRKNNVELLLGPSRGTSEMPCESNWALVLLFNYFFFLSVQWNLWVEEKKMSKSCKGLAEELVKCLSESNCMKLENRSFRDCAGEKSPCISSECVGLRETYFNCKRGQVDMRARIRGNKGY